jgi:hypothetical protein
MGFLSTCIKEKRWDWWENQAVENPPLDGNLLG